MKFMNPDDSEDFQDRVGIVEKLLVDLTDTYAPEEVYQGSVRFISLMIVAHQEVQGKVLIPDERFQANYQKICDFCTSLAEGD